MKKYDTLRLRQFFVADTLAELYTTCLKMDDGQWADVANTLRKVKTAPFQIPSDWEAKPSPNSNSTESVLPGKSEPFKIKYTYNDRRDPVITDINLHVVDKIKNKGSK